MSQELINHSEDLKRLKDDGYKIEIVATFLLVLEVPYVNANREVCFGTLVSSLSLSGNKTAKPDNHVCHFKGEQPCHSDGSIIVAIQHNTKKSTLACGVEVCRSFSNKPKEGYQNYYDKMTRYCTILENEAKAIDPSVSAKNHSKNGEIAKDNSVFVYADTNTGRAEIGNITDKLSSMKVAIIGLGGTGSYLLDFLAKTKVKEIHIFDDDELQNHNAFRMPGAVPLEVLNEGIKKVAYLQEMYSKMRKGIVKNECKVTEKELSQIAQSGINFVFVSIDNGTSRKLICDYLQAKEISFIDVGIDVQKRVGNSLLAATARTTFVGSRDATLEDYIPFANGKEGVYNDPNIQIAEMNALNATIAIIRWKKWAEVYEDCSKEIDSSYDLSQNKILHRKC